ncbi:ABC transporter permease [Plantibacter sp. YIM 135347]|uniref:ABC transporter permease n=1 Tax=Plantibacter sp. YIM 135347 TaxID=3423919 RepID=UPI003D347B02
MFRLLVLQARRDRFQLPIWIIGAGLLALTSSSAVGAEFGTEADRANLLKVAVATPSIIALRGVPDGASTGSYVFFQVFVYVSMVAAFMSVFFVTRHTRADEERGRLELLRSTPVGRTAGAVATLVLGVLANLLLGLVVALAFIAGGLEARGSLLAGLAAAGVGIAFIGIGLLMAQLAPTSRAANGIGSALVGVAFVLRAAGDALGEPRADGLSITSAWPSWLSPIGWGQQTFAFTKAEATPLLLLVGLTIVTVVVAFVLQATRDLGSSVIRERDGRAAGRPAFHSNIALVWRMHWPTIVGWVLGGAVLGALGGGLANNLASALTTDSSITAVIAGLVPGGRGGLADLFVAAILGIAGVLAAAAGVQAIIRARSEEVDGRAELVLAAPVGRIVWLADYLLVAVLSVLAVAFAAGLACGLTFLVTGSDVDRLWSSIGGGLAQLPAGLVYVAITALLFAFVPRLTIPVGWALLGAGFVVGQLGGLLQLSQGVRDASPFTHTPAVPTADADWSGAVVLCVIAIVLAGLSIVAVRGREMTA